MQDEQLAGRTDLLRRTFPAPAERPAFKPFRWALDGGGRELIEDVLHSQDVRLMLEIGVLYGGSALRWLEQKRDLILVGLDPWEFDQAQATYWWSNRVAYGLSNLDTMGMDDDEFLRQLLAEDAGYLTTVSNVWEYRDRFIPVRGRSPEMLYKFGELDISFDAIYFDSDKELDDLEVCRQLFPAAILCGDDWWWSREGEPDRYPVQEAVFDFAAKHGLKVTAERASWVLSDG
jgi:predicted O-methyltransferase YrrM